MSATRPAREAFAIFWGGPAIGRLGRLDLDAPLRVLSDAELLTIRAATAELSAAP